MSRYHDVYAAWQRDPLAFWAAAASAIDWFEPWEAVLAPRDGLDRWFVGAVCNTTWNCLDRHVAAGHGERRALIYDSPVTGTKRRSTTTARCSTRSRSSPPFSPISASSRATAS